MDVFKITIVIYLDASFSLTKRIKLLYVTIFFYVGTTEERNNDKNNGMEIKEESVMNQKHSNTHLKNGTSS